ncbi:MAG: stage II sporulation protein D [Clostridia bacterium]|nr:stage II sporulation protein D [Clostridia bacterium]
MVSERQKVRWAALLLGATLLWWLLGSPVTGQDWHALPSHGRMALRQLPARAARILKLWLPPAASQLAAQRVTVYDDVQGRTDEMPLQEYLLGTLAAEMPASYHLEALKAQAVAAQTRLANPGHCASFPQAQICLRSDCCQGYLSPEDRQARWGADTPAYEKRLRHAIAAVDGLILTYEGQPVSVLYHAVSGGRTEDAQQVFGQSLPYLISVPSPGEEGSARFETQSRFTCEEAARLLNAAFPQAHVEPSLLSAQLAVRETSPTGRALTVQVGDLMVTGRELRQALGLASTWLSIQCGESALVITQRGYGHGVGMSQAGANAMAANGSDMAAILAHYYPGTQLHDSRRQGAI